MEFRAWDHDNYKMIFWTLPDLLLRFGEPEYQFNVEDRPSFLFDWMQYTQLKDKHNNKIYEGDILKYENYMLEVKFKNGAFIAGNFYLGDIHSESIIKNDIYNSILIELVNKNDVEKIKKLIADGVDINYQDLKGLTALMVASFLGRYEVVKLLANSNAKLDLQDKWGNTYLDYAREKEKNFIKRIIKLLN